VIIVNGIISSVYHKKGPKCWLKWLLCNCFECTCREPLDEHPEQYDDFLYCPKSTCIKSKCKTPDKSTTDEEMGLLPQQDNPTENNISLDNSMLENIKNINNTVEKDVKHQEKGKRNKRIWSGVALNCDIVCGGIFIIAYSAVNIAFLTILFSGKHNIA
jgi:hypothetical protein